MKRFGLTAVAAFLMTGILCACGAGSGTSTTAAPQTTKAEAAETKARTETETEAKGETGSFTVEGKYTFYGAQDLDSGNLERPGRSME